MRMRKILLLITSVGVKIQLVFLNSCEFSCRLVIIILCFETAPGNKSYLSVEQNINYPFRLTSFGISIHVIIS